jgi:hypothetical protein
MIMKHKPGVWYPAEDIPDPDEQYMTMALLITGARGKGSSKIKYKRAIFADEGNCYEDGKYYVAGNYYKGIIVHGWYLIPLPEEI